MSQVQLLNGAIYPHDEVVFAIHVLDSMCETDQYGFTRFVELCRSRKGKRHVAACIRDVARCSTQGGGLDMLLVHPVVLRKPKPGQEIIDMLKFWDMDLRGWIKLSGYHIS